MTPLVDLLVRLAMGSLALCGLAVSVDFGRNALLHKEVELTCADGTCIRLSKTPYARVFFAIPNWFFGILYYLLTIIALIFTSPWLVALAMAGALISTLFSLYLIWSLAFKLKVICKLCYTAHVINIALLIFWLVLIAKG